MEINASIQPTTELGEAQARMATTLLALRRSEEHARDVVDSISDGFLTLDMEWRVTSINRRGEEIVAPLRKTHANTLGKYFWDEFPATVGTVFEASYRRAMEQRVPVTLEAFYPPLDAWIEVRAYPGKLGLALHFVDVTERKNAATALAAAHAALAKTNESLEAMVAARTAALRETVAELEAFSYSISHDLRGPLRVMASFAEALQEDCGPTLGPNGRDYVRRIVASSERMDRIIQDVLVYSRLARHDVELAPIDLDTLVHGLLESYPQFAEGTAKVTVHSPLAWVLGYEAGLTQCLSNLLGNAVKFVAPGVFPEVQISGSLQGSRRVISVRDNGIGIDDRDLEKIFDPFYRLDNRFPGTGIGLAIVKKTAEKMGGTISVRSRKGQGSEFLLELGAVQP